MKSFAFKANVLLKASIGFLYLRDGPPDNLAETTHLAGEIF